MYVFSAIAVVLLTAHVVRFGDYIADDAGITFAYAKNLARGHGLVLNPGTDPVEGYSSFAWVLLMVPFCARGTDPTWPVKVFSVALSGVTLIVLNATGQRLFATSSVRGYPGLRNLAAIGLAASTPFAAWTAGGMENPLYCLLFVLAIWCYARDNVPGCAAALVGLAMTRVEALAFVVLFLVHRTGVLIWRRRAPSSREMLAAVIVTMGYGTYALWHWHHFQSFYPNSYLVKAPVRDIAGLFAILMNFRGSGWAYLHQYLLQYHMYVVAPLMGLALFCASGETRSLFALLGTAVSSLIVLAGGDFYPELRLGTLILPLMFLLLAEGCRIAVARIRPRALAAIAAIVPVIVVCYPSLAASSRFGKPVAFGVLRTQRADLYLKVAKEVGEPRLTVVDGNIGNVAYLTDFPIIDAGGLANLHLALFGAYFGREYVFDEVQPDVIHLDGDEVTQAQIPFELMARDYLPLYGGRSIDGYAEGAFLKRTLANRSQAEIESAHQAVLRDGPEAIREAWASLSEKPGMPRDDLFRRVQRYCDTLGVRCTDRGALSKGAETVADGYRRRFLFREAFAWYAAAVRADPTNLPALRNREWSRLAMTGPTALLRRHRFAETRAFYEDLFAQGWRPHTEGEFAGVAEAVSVAGLRPPPDALRALK